MPFYQQDRLWITTFLLLSIASYFIYSFGASGVFIFDDIHNLSPMGKYHDLSGWDNFWLFILEGNSGPTGRPISLASFYLNASSWPTTATGFINTNIILHLFNGGLVFWLSFKLSKQLGLKQSQPAVFAFLLSALWVLNPIHTTSVLYVIQRMTELSATFMLAGILFYLYGREQLSHNLKKGFVTLFLGVGLSLLLSVLSKENGILLVAYILVIEYFLFQPLKNSPPKHFYYWLIPAVVIPFLAIIIYLGLKTNPDGFSHRNFTLTERLLTEPRIIFDYLQHILLPNTAYTTLFHDDYLISKSLFEPFSTLTALAGLIILGISAFLLRKKAPVIAFAIAWFFAGHLIESTVIALELYFEHRNYLPSYGVLFPIAWYGTKFISAQQKIVITAMGMLMVLYSFVTWQNAKLWGQPLELATSWYKIHPESERTKQAYLILTQAYGVTPVLNNKPALSTKKQSMFYTTSVMLDLVNYCSSNTLTDDHLNTTILQLKKHHVTASTATKLKEFISLWQAGKCETISIDNIENYLLSLNNLKKVQKDRNFSYVTNSLLSDVYFKKKDLSKTMHHLDKAYSYQPTFQTLEQRASYLASAGLYNEALDVLNDTSRLKTDLRARLALSIKQKRLERMKQLIYSEIKKLNKPKL